MRSIVFLGFDEVTALDISGPSEVFATANTLRMERPDDAPYDVVIASVHDKPFRAEAGFEIAPTKLCSEIDTIDTLIIPGGAGLRDPAVNTKAVQEILRWAPHTRRVVSVCTGIYGLAATGLLNGRRVTTHWRFVEDVRNRFPDLIIDTDPIFVRDGKYYSSAGIAAGIDLSLALVEDDLGTSVSLDIARELVLYLRRPGEQAQLSKPLSIELLAQEPLPTVVRWIEEHLDTSLNVPDLATLAGLGERQFARRFKSALGVTPATYVEERRISVAAALLLQSQQSVDQIAMRTGFKSADVFRRAFERRYSLNPTTYRERFSLTFCQTERKAAPDDACVATGSISGQERAWKARAAYGDYAQQAE